jgi:hypothetical protein
MNPSPEQIAEWQAEAKKQAMQWYADIQCHMPINVTDIYIQGYLRARTEQATEIAALKAQIAELMPLAKFGALIIDSRPLMIHGYGTIDRAIEAGLISDEGSDGFVLRDIAYKPNIKATIEQLLKD